MIDRVQGRVVPSEPEVSNRQLAEVELIRRVCAGEKDLYYELIRPYERSVFLSALAIMHNEADAEDVAQESFLKAYWALPSFRFESRFSTWLDRIAVNEARMRLRRLRSHKTESLDEAESEPKEHVPFLLSDWREIPSEALERTHRGRSGAAWRGSSRRQAVELHRYPLR